MTMAKNTIMVVDDDTMAAQAIIDVLESKGYKGILAINGGEALEKLKEIKPDLILLDFFLPDISGRGVCEKIRAIDELKDIKIIFLTGSTFTESGKEELKKLGVVDFIAKPFEIKYLIGKIEKTIGI